MSNQIITASFTNQSAKGFVDSFAKDNNYLLVGRHLATGNDQEVSTITDTDFEKTAVFDHLICGVKISSADVATAIVRQDWTLNQIYNVYDSAINNTSHVNVHAGSLYHVYRCIDNNRDARSTVEPSGTSNLPFKTADGYIWIYMYTITSTVFDKFATVDVIPYSANTARISAAVPSTVDLIKVLDGGTGYTNYTTGSFSVTDIKVSNSTTYRLNTNATATANVYRGCIIRVTTPSSPAFGQWRTVVSYSADRVATINSAFINPPQVNDAYEVAPAISIVAGGPDAIPAAAIGKIVGGTVNSVEILNRGSSHRTAVATVAADPAATPVRVASVFPVLSPLKGHGNNPAVELGANKVAVQKDLDFAAVGLPNANDYRTIALLKNPTYDNVALSITSLSPLKFEPEETLIQYRVVGSVGAVSYNSTTLTGTSTAFTSTLANQPYLLITSGSNKFITKITSVSTDTAAVGSTAYSGTFAGTGYVVDITATAKVRGNNGNTLVINQATPTFNIGKPIYGDQSYSSDTITGININGKGIASFATVIQATTVLGSISGTFSQDETVKASAALTATSPSAALHSVGSGRIYLTNPYKSLAETQLVGITSSATITPTAKYDGDLTTDSGDLLFVKHVLPITKASGKATSVRLVFQF